MKKKKVVKTMKGACIVKCEVCGHGMTRFASVRLYTSTKEEREAATKKIDALLQEPYTCIICEINA